MLTVESDLSRDVLNAYDECRQIIRRAAKTFYWGSLLLPQRKRLATWALYAFCRSVDDSVDQACDMNEARRALEMWRTRLTRLYAGTPSDAVTLAWLHMLQDYDVPLQPALDLIDGVEMDLTRVRLGTFDELKLYCYRVAGTVGLLMSPVLGYRSPAALPHAVDLGIAMQLTNILRDIGEDAANDRIYIPREELERFGYRETDLIAGTINPAFMKLMRFSIARAHDYYERARPGIELLDGGAQFAIHTSAQLYRGILGAIEANHYDVFSQRAYVSMSTKLMMMPKIWLGMKTAALTSPLPQGAASFQEME